MSIKVHRFSARAYADHFRMIEVAALLGAAPGLTDPKDAVYRKTEDGGVYAFNFGVLAFWNCDEKTQQEEITKLLPAGIPPRNGIPDGHKITGYKDDFVVEENPDAKPRVEFSKLVVDRLTPERAEVIAFTLAQSVAMEYYESLLSGIWSDVAFLVNGMRVRGKVAERPRRLHRIIGQVVAIRNSVMTVLHLLDRPDLIWDDRVMDSLYGDLRAVFDLPERLQAMQFKLETIQDSLEILIDTSRDARMYFVELAIVFLIAVDIMVYFFEF